RRSADTMDCCCEQRHWEDTLHCLASEHTGIFYKLKLSGEAARSAPGQAESIASERPKRGLDDEAEPELVSADVSASDVAFRMLARRMLDMSDISTSDVSPSEQPAASRDGKHPSSGFNPKTSGTGCLCITINGPSLADLDYSKALEEFFQKPRRITCKK
ncbi:unnamed protein product, partial [Pleuronectes platessa]